MKRVYQTIIDPERGDCERAAVATILGLPIEEVPNFVDPELPVSQWLRQWVHTQGYGLIELKGDRGVDSYTWTGLEGLVALASVPSQMYEGSSHAIVVGWRQHPEHEGALECYVVHDPNPRNAPYEDVGKLITRLLWFVPHTVDASTPKFTIELFDRLGAPLERIVITGGTEEQALAMANVAARVYDRKYSSTID